VKHAAICSTQQSTLFMARSTAKIYMVTSVDGQLAWQWRKAA